MSKRKVVILCNKLTGGGVEKIMQDLANYLAAKTDEYDVTVTTLEGPDEGRELFNSRIKIKGVFRSESADKKLSVAWAWFKIKQLLYCVYLTLGRYDIVLAVKDGWYTKLGAHMKANRKIAWIHTDFSYAHWTSAFYKDDIDEVKSMQKYDAVICVSEVVKNSICSTIGNPGNLMVLYNPVNVESIRKKAQEQNHEIVLKHPLFVTASRLSADKQVIKILECCKRLKGKYDFSVWIIGDGEEKHVLDKFVSDNELTNVKLLGWKDNPYSYISMADWYVSASACESYGLTVQEAGVLGIPSLVATLPVFEECADEKKVLLVENSVKGLLDGMSEILEGKVRLNVSENTESLNRMLYKERFEIIERAICG